MYAAKNPIKNAYRCVHFKINMRASYRMGEEMNED